MMRYINSHYITLQCG